MPSSYLLPCKCGRKHPVEPTQAGQQIPCDCGNLLAIPTLLEMRKLEPARAVVADKNGTSWGVAQRTIVAGIVLCLVGVALVAYFWLRRPELPDDTTIRRIVQQQVEAASPSELIWMWQTMRSEGLQPGRDKAVRSLLEWRRRYNLAMAGSCVVILAGGVVVVCALVTYRNTGAKAH
mgnify:CR=1 FL=1